MRVRTGASQVAESALRRRCHHSVATMPVTTHHRDDQADAIDGIGDVVAPDESQEDDRGGPGRRRRHRRGVEARRRDVGGAGDDRHDAAERTDPSGDRDGGRAVFVEEPACAAQCRAQPAAPAVRRDRLLAEASPDEVPDGVTGDCTEQGGADHHPTGVPFAAAAAPATTNPTSPGTTRSVTMMLSPNTRAKTKSGEGDALGPADEVDQSIGDGRGYPDDRAGKHRRRRVFVE